MVAYGPERGIVHLNSLTAAPTAFYQKAAKRNEKIAGDE